VTALQKSDRHNSVVLRLCEIQGEPTATPVLFLGEASKREANLLEGELAGGKIFFISVVQTAQVPGILYMRSSAKIPFAGSC
jgi:hypothetical protein